MSVAATSIEFTMGAKKLSSESESLALGLMAKYWDVGRVKTRLGRTIGMERAAALHKLFVSHLCQSLADVADQNSVSIAPDSSVDKFKRELRSWGLDGSWMTIPQGEGHLGERMERWFIHSLAETSAERQCPAAILIGSDCPSLARDTIEQARNMLQSCDVVLGPCVDGGYYLIGIRGSWESRRTGLESLFRDIPWSSSEVLATTHSRLHEAGLSYRDLDTREDIDTIDELERLRESLRTSHNNLKLKLGIEAIMTDPSSSPSKP